MNQTVLEIKKLLEASGKTVAVAESITAGHIQSMLSSVSGSSHFFTGGITAYKLSVKIDVLGVDPILAEKHDCVHIDIARQMAQGALKLFKTDYAIATCGYAEAYPTQGITNPFAYIAIAQVAVGGVIPWANGERLDLHGSRVEAQIQTAQTALDLFCNKLGQQS